ncbi:C39 family peptidase [Deinococcus hopiensis]|uniref:ABC-type bacteriocin/lantibiotic exporters, contain an N-terminal double-glycine peptidase domain n=1 Tax=Deinococcus hopiensis KR-140 TaxID=695939 RepID=A0A1W1VDZ5_9DEIO|nr:C39 family peptidase [Deinococcus hopiensis]SMB91619.1 ABC-type bacteriocin/lantibiotic exporters, contain an N-terminal double-glycine peptidase domain [Deinococcus hopiensis KR-140]
MRFLLPLLLTALLAQAAATAPKASSGPTGYVLSGMPLVRQTYNACGPASLTEVLAYFGVDMAMEDVSRLTRPTERSYMTAQAIVDFAPQVGMEARLFRGGTLNTVRAAIRNRLPLIALQSHITTTQVIPHWRVVAGYDDAAQQVYLMDPLLGYVRMGYADFLRVWADHQGQFAVMYPPDWRGTVKKVIG